MLALTIAPPALGCPFCDSDTAEETHAGIFNHQFIPALFAGVIPFVIVAGIALAIHFDRSSIRNAAHRSKEATP